MKTPIQFEKEFPFVEKFTFLDTASSGSFSQSVLHFRQSYDKAFNENPHRLLADEKEKIDSVKSSIARYFGSQANQVGLVPNFSIGFNFLLDAIPENSKILLLKTDYPSVNLPVQARNFNIDYAQIDENLEENISAKVTEFQPDYLVFSCVQFLNGIRLSESFLAELKQRNPQLFLIADATQYAGTTNFNFADSPYDVFGLSAYKWLNAGLGNGFFLVKDRLKKQLQPRTIGSNSLITKPDGKPRDLGFFEPGHYDMLSILSLQKALDFHYQEVGINFIEQQIQLLSEQAKTAFLKRNLLENSVVKRKEHASIFNLKGDDKLFAFLIENNILCAQRGKGIRVGFQYFNTTEDLEKLLFYIDKY
ncbi:MAG: aminotransferase class V-fold PLP-dependent enzyme [Bacteroidota bacterium]